MATRTLYNATTQAKEEATLSVDANDEIVATFANGHFMKAPAGMTKEAFEAWLVSMEQGAKDQVIITPEMEAAKKAERDASLALIGETPPPAAPAASAQPSNGNPMPGSEQSNAPGTAPAQPQ